MNVIDHYDKLIDEGNDPFFDPKPLREYMDKWDGQPFIDALSIDKSKSVLEIGVGTGRLAARVALGCGELMGIDISPKTAERARKNLREYENVRVVCGDFLIYDFNKRFDVIYSSLTFMHIEDKSSALKKVASLLSDYGRFVLSIDKNQGEYIEIGTRKLKIYPDTPESIKENILSAGMSFIKEFQTEFAYIFVCKA